MLSSYTNQYSPDHFSGESPFISVSPLKNILSNSPFALALDKGAIDAQAACFEM